MSRKLILKEQELQICEEYLNGINIKELAIIYNCNIGDIYYFLKNNKIKLEKISILKNSSKEICEKYINGENSNFLAKEYNCSPDTIIRILKKYNIQIRAKGSHQNIFTKEQELDIHNLYMSGLNSGKLSKQFNCSVSTIRLVVKKHGGKIKTISETRIRKFNIEQGLDICEKYLKGMNTIQLAIEYSTSHTNICNLLEKNNIITRPRSDSIRIYSLDEGFFDVMSRVVAYVLGWLYADGCNHLDRNYISIGLQERDKPVLDIMSKYFKTDIPLVFVEGTFIRTKNKEILLNKFGEKCISQHQYVLNLNSKRLCQVLEELGCVPAKSLILKFPTVDQVPEKYIPDFIKGAFEGDGCVRCEMLGNYLDTYICYIGTEEFLTGMKTWLLKNGVKFIYLKHPKQYKNNTWVLEIRNILDVLKFKELIYDNYFKEYPDGDLYLQRKWDTFCKIQNYADNNKGKIDRLINLREIHRPENELKIIDMRVNQKISYQKIANHFNVGISVILGIIKRGIK